MTQRVASGNQQKSSSSHTVASKNSGSKPKTATPASNRAGIASKPGQHGKLTSGSSHSVQPNKTQQPRYQRTAIEILDVPGASIGGQVGGNLLPNAAQIVNHPSANPINWVGSTIAKGLDGLGQLFKAQPPSPAKAGPRVTKVQHSPVPISNGYGAVTHAPLVGNKTAAANSEQSQAPRAPFETTATLPTGQTVDKTKPVPDNTEGTAVGTGHYLQSEESANGMFKKKKKVLLFHNGIKVDLTSKLKPIPPVESLKFGQKFADHMYYQFYDGSWKQGRISPLRNLSIHPAAGHYGQFVFEGFKVRRTKDGALLGFRLWDHAQRMGDGLAALSMAALRPDEIVQAIKTLVGIDHRWVPFSPNRDTALYGRPFARDIEGTLGAKPAKRYGNFIITSPTGPYFADPSTGLALSVSGKPRTAPGLPGHVKAAGNYAPAMGPTEDAKRLGFDAALFLDSEEQKYIEEAGTMNIFVHFRNGSTQEVATPSLDKGTILDGITGRSLKQLLRLEGIEVSERPIALKELMQANRRGNLLGIVGTGTAANIAPVNILGAKDYMLSVNKGKPDELFQRIAKVLHEIQTGEREDRFGWTTEIPPISPDSLSQ